MKRPSLISVILPVLVCIFICILSFGPVMAQSSLSRPFVSKYAPPQTPKEVPKETPATSAPTEKVTPDPNKQSASKPEPQIKMGPVRITLGGQNNGGITDIRP